MSTDVKFVELPQAECVVPIKTNKLSLNVFLKHLTTGSVLEHLIEILPKCNEDGP